MNRIRFGLAFVLLACVVAAASGDEPRVVAAAAAITRAAPAEAGDASRQQGGFEQLAQSRLSKCLVCCAERQASCYKEKGRGACDTLHNNCVAHCNSQGSTPSDWLCWR